MAKIFNPTKTPYGVRLPSNVKAFIRPGETVDLNLDAEQLAKLEKRGCIVSDGLEEIIAAIPFDPGKVHVVTEKQPQVSDDFAHEFIADLNRLQSQSSKSDNEGDLDNLTDDQLRAMAKSRGLKVHHKAGRAKLLEALGA